MIEHTLLIMWVMINKLYFEVAFVILAAVFHILCHITVTL